MNGSTKVAIVGAGAAGLAAARTLTRLGVEHRVLEASHRIGGRAYTEEPVAGMPLDLGCHWLHSGSINPLVPLADEMGFAYQTAKTGRAVYRDDKRLDQDAMADLRDRFAHNAEALKRLRTAGRDIPLSDAIDRSEPWTALIDYEISLYASHDSDQVSALDYANAKDTDEDWPVRDGLGALIAAYGTDVEVTLNAAVERVDWSGKAVRLTTPRGTLEAERVVLTVSTGILGSGDIRFDPPLPGWKSEAIADLPLGGHNRIYLIFERDVFGPEAPPYASVLGGPAEAMDFVIRPFGRNCVHAMTGGRFADWLERAGEQASVDLATVMLCQAFGSAIAKHITRYLVTAWRGDPWTRGAYSAAKPGCADQRAKLAQPIDDRLFFAGEAVSKEHYATAHGAYMSGLAAAEAVAASLGVTTDNGG